MHIDQAMIETQKGHYRQKAYMSNLLEQNPRALQHKLQVTDCFYLDNNLKIKRNGQLDPAFDDQILNENRVSYWDAAEQEVANSNSTGVKRNRMTNKSQLIHFDFQPKLALFKNHQYIDASYALKLTFQ